MKLLISAVVAAMVAHSEPSPAATPEQISTTLDLLDRLFATPIFAKADLGRALDISPMEEWATVGRSHTLRRFVWKGLSASPITLHESDGRHAPTLLVDFWDCVPFSVIAERYGPLEDAGDRVTGHGRFQLDYWKTGPWSEIYFAFRWPQGFPLETDACLDQVVIFYGQVRD